MKKIDYSPEPSEMSSSYNTQSSATLSSMKPRREMSQFIKYLLEGSRAVRLLEIKDYADFVRVIELVGDILPEKAFYSIIWENIEIFWLKSTKFISDFIGKRMFSCKHVSVRSRSIEGLSKFIDNLPPFISSLDIAVSIRTGS